MPAGGNAGGRAAGGASEDNIEFKGGKQGKVWETESDTFAALQGQYSPIIGEISSLQYSRMSKAARARYDKDRRARSEAASAKKDEFFQRIDRAYAAGRFNENTPGISREVRSYISAKKSRASAASAASARDAKVAANRVTSPQTGQRVYSPIYGYGTVKRVNKDSVTLNLAGGRSIKAPLRGLSKVNPGEL